MDASKSYAVKVEEDEDDNSSKSQNSKDDMVEDTMKHLVSSNPSNGSNEFDPPVDRLIKSIHGGVKDIPQNDCHKCSSSLLQPSYIPAQTDSIPITHSFSAINDLDRALSKTIVKYLEKVSESTVNQEKILEIKMKQAIIQNEMENWKDNLTITVPNEMKQTQEIINDLKEALVASVLTTSEYCQGSCTVREMVQLTQQSISDLKAVNENCSSTLNKFYEYRNLLETVRDRLFHVDSEVLFDRSKVWETLKDEFSKLHSSFASTNNLQCYSKWYAISRLKRAMDESRDIIDKKTDDEDNHAIPEKIPENLSHAYL